MFDRVAGKRKLMMFVVVIKSQFAFSLNRNKFIESNVHCKILKCKDSK